ncbi:MAG: MFS transporter, partial [Ktedonobacterales bacterium]
MSDVSDQLAASAAPTTPRPKVGAYAWYVFWLMCGLNFVNYADRYIFTAVSDTIKTVFSFSDTQIGLFGSAFLIVYAVLAFPLGYLAERFSRKIVV